MADKETKIEDRFQIVEVTTQTDLAIKDNASGSILDDKQVVIEMLNLLEKIKKAVV